MKLINIAYTKIKLILKEKSSIAWMVLAPILFITVVVYGFEGTDGKTQLTFVDYSKSSESAEFIKLFKQNNEYPVTIQNLEEAKSRLVNGTSIAVVVIPKDFNEILDKTSTKSSFEILKIRDNERIIAVQNIIESTIYKQRIGIKIGKVSLNTLEKFLPVINDEAQKSIPNDIEKKYEEEMNDPKITLIEPEEVTDKHESFTEMSYSTIGIMLIFIMFFIASSSGSIIDEKKNGTLERLQYSGTTQIEIVFGQIFSLLVVGWIQVALLLLIGKYLYKINWGSSYVGLILLFTAFLLCSATLGVLLANLSKNRKQLISLIALVIMPTSLLGGCMWSKEMMSELLIKVSYFTPQSWMMDGIIDVVVRDTMNYIPVIPIIALLLFSCFFILCNFLVNHFRKK